MRIHRNPGIPTQAPCASSDSLAAGTISGIFVFAAGILAIQVPDMLLPPGQVNHDGYGQVLAIVGVIMISQLMVPVGFIVSQVTARSFKKEGL